MFGVCRRGTAPRKDGIVMAKLYYQGHGSFRITAQSGYTIYVDPYAGDGYDVPADLILVTHHHSDHDQVSLVAQKTETRVITPREALQEKGYLRRVPVGEILLSSVEAYNDKHSRSECVGYVIEVDSVSVYAAGDTSFTQDMSRVLPWLHLDYALLPIDGIYNMNAAQAAACAKTIGARHTIPIHMKPGHLFDPKIARTFDAPGALIVPAGKTITLTPAT